MTKIGPHGDLMIRTILLSPARFFLENRGDNAAHIGTAMQMFCLVKRAVGFAHDLAKMHEMDSWREFVHHRKQVVVGACSIRSDTKGQPVRLRIAACENRTCVLSGGDHARQAEQGPWRIVRMD